MEVLKTLELNKKKNKSTIIYDDIPKLTTAEEDKEIKENKKKLREKKLNAEKNKAEKKEIVKDKVEKKEPINEIGSAVK